MKLNYKKAAYRRFGVEIEVNKQISKAKLVSGLKSTVGNGIQGVEWQLTCNNTEWQVKPDSSCGDTGNRKDGGGFEIISPASKGVKHLLEVEQVTRRLKEMGAKINRFCGLHCQVEIKDFTVLQVSTLLAHWCLMEPFILGMVPSHRVNNEYCVPFTSTNSWETAKKQIVSNDLLAADTFWNIMKLKGLSASYKRNAMTLINYQRTISNSNEWYNFDRPTAELRIPESSLDAYDVKNWARFFVTFVSHVKNLPFPDLKQKVSLQNCLSFMGLSSFDGDQVFNILSPGLHETKVWVLWRILKYSTNSSMKSAAKDALSLVTTPRLKWKYEFDKIV